jgi:hypothetical protein
MPRDREAPFDPRLMCGVESLSYDFLAREGRLDMPAGRCCDMAGGRAAGPRVAAPSSWSGSHD